MPGKVENSNGHLRLSAGVVVVVNTKRLLQRCEGRGDGQKTPVNEPPNRGLRNQIFNVFSLISAPNGATTPPWNAAGTLKHTSTTNSERVVARTGRKLFSIRFS
jgi:hypothetical protein